MILAIYICVMFSRNIVICKHIGSKIVSTILSRRKRILSRPKITIAVHRWLYYLLAIYICVMFSRKIVNFCYTVDSHLEMSLIEINLNCFSYSLTCYL